MVPVGMGEDNVVMIFFFLDQLIAESSDSGSGINNDDVIASGSDFHACRITAVFDIIFSGNRDRSSRPPAFDKHELPFRLN